MNKEFFRGMKEQIKPDEEQVEELKNKLNNTAAVSRKPLVAKQRKALSTVHMIQRSTTARRTIRPI